MSTISAYDSSSINTLFSGLNTSTSSKSNNSGLLGINFADYNSIKSGNYYKLMKSYYAEVVDSDSSATSSSTSTSKDTTAQIARIEETAEAMTDAAGALLKNGSSSVFNKVSSTDSAGKTTLEYNKDAIYKKVSDFVDSYNSLIKEAGASKDNSIATAAASLVNMTNKNSALLESVGISFDSKDYTLSIDEAAFKKANMTDVKSLFNGAGSYGYQVSAKASMINYYAQNEAAKANTYTNSGMFTYNYSTGEIYNTTT